MRKAPLIMLLAATVSASGCADLVYRRTDVGNFQGQLEVRWVEPNRFVYVPNASDPLTFKTGDGRVITPRVMYTDGGSIPRLFWGVPGYSPWGYAPAYIIHDWLFAAHHCGYSDYAWVSFDDSSRILAEGIKTLMETNVAPKDETTLYSIYEAVKTPIAENLWNASGRCDTPTRPQPPAPMPAPPPPIGSLPPPPPVAPVPPPTISAPPGRLLFNLDMNDIKRR